MSIENATFAIIFFTVFIFQTKLAVSVDAFCTTFWGGTKVAKVAVTTDNETSTLKMLCQN